MQKWRVGRVLVQSPGYSECQRLPYLDVKSREVAEQLCVIGEVRAATGGAHHVCDVLLLQGDGEVLAEAVRTDGTLTGSQGLHPVARQHPTAHSTLLGKQAAQEGPVLALPHSFYHVP